MKIAVIVPTIRPELFESEFMPAWSEVFKKNKVHLYAVHDGDTPKVVYRNMGLSERAEELETATYPFIYNRTDAVRNLGFLTALQHVNPDIYISLDDDVLPQGDTIAAHVEALQSYVSLDWMNTANEYRMRGLPYKMPKYPVLLSHGTWAGVPDFDAVQQLQYPDVRNVDTHNMPIARGAYFPVCAMNMAFHKSVLPWIYQAPMGKKLEADGLPPIDRFADIWGGVIAKHAIDNILGGAAWTGAAKVYHKRASDVFTNLRKEALGMELNEDLWQWAVHICMGFDHEVEFPPHPYIQLYHTRLIEWQKEVKTYGIF